MELALGLITLISTLAPLAAKAVTARKEEHAQILADAAAAFDEFSLAVAGLPGILGNHDAAADALLEETTAVDAAKATVPEPTAVDVAKDTLP